MDYVKNRMVWAWAGTWLTLAAVFYMYAPRVRVRPEYLGYESVVGHVLGGLALFDASSYLTLTADGYIDSPPGLKAFFPLYPLVLRVVSAPLEWVTQEPFSIMLAAIVVNLVAMTVAVVLLRRLVQLDYDAKVARNTALILLLFPFSFFFLAPYTEAMFLLLVVGSFYAARRDKWWLACLLVGLATATRLPGLALAPALLFEYCHQREWKLRRLFPRVLWFILTPLGALSYFGYLQLYKGGWQTYQLAYSASWPDRHFSLNFLAPIVSPIADLVQHGQMIRPNDILGLMSAAVVVVALAVAVRRRIRPSYIVFMVVSFILPLLSQSLDSLGRYYMLVFGVHVCLALLLTSRPKLLALWLIGSGALSVALMYAFIAGVFVG